MKFEDKLAQAFKETLDERTEKLMKVEKKHLFSLAYRLWERKMLRDLRRNRVDKRWSLKRARYAAAAMITAFALLIGGSAYAAIIISSRFAFEDTVDYTRLLVEKHPSDKTTFEEYYGLPQEDDWEITYADLEHFNTQLRLKYKRGDSMVIFLQKLVHEGNMEQFYDKNADVEILSLYSDTDGFLIKPEKGDASICWVYDGYFFRIVGDFDKEEAINLAYSTKIIEIPEKFEYRLLR